jgi:hypothetical protein
MSWMPRQAYNALTTDRHRPRRQLLFDGLAESLHPLARLGDRLHVLLKGNPSRPLTQLQAGDPAPMGRCPRRLPGVAQVVAQQQRRQLMPGSDLFPMVASALVAPMQLRHGGAAASR